MAVIRKATGVLNMADVVNHPHKRIGALAQIDRPLDHLNARFDQMLERETEIQELLSGGECDQWVAKQRIRFKERINLSRAAQVLQVVSTRITCE